MSNATNFPIFISTMSVGAIHAEARGYGLLSAAMAVGTVGGALFSASRVKPRREALPLSAGAFGIGCALAAIAPNAWFFAGALA